MCQASQMQGLGSVIRYMSNNRCTGMTVYWNCKSLQGRCQVCRELLAKDTSKLQHWERSQAHCNRLQKQTLVTGLLHMLHAHVTCIQSQSVVSALTHVICFGPGKAMTHRHRLWACDLCHIY